MRQKSGAGTVRGAGARQVNCLKKRTSFSKKRRISLMPNLSIVILSIPIPKAKPENYEES